MDSENQKMLISSGSIEVICGSMFSGKTEELLRRLNRAKIAKLTVQVFKPKTDHRYHNSKVVSHDASQIEALAVSSSINILSHINSETQVVGIDEAQFFDDSITEVSNQLANKGIRVIIAGLDMDFKGNPFGPMPKLLAIADQITKVRAICMSCGHLANYSFRKSLENQLVMLGKQSEYDPLCRACFHKKKRLK